jgi:hypothetical protein
MIEVLDVLGVSILYFHYLKKFLILKEEKFFKEEVDLMLSILCLRLISMLFCLNLML